ncbi:MAG: proprotein convertase P-domain-containing protein, partial [Bacteroidota bacterium]
MADAGNFFGDCGTDADNLDVCIVLGTGNPLTNNTQYICNTGPCSSGTCCLTGIWTMPCGGVTDPVTGAQQAPGCDLNDFNNAGDPANGTWTLTVNDICSQDVGTLNNFSLTFACGTLVCTVCEADGGSLNAPNVEGCFGDPDLNLNLPPTFSGPPPNPGDYSYAYVLAQNGIITAVNPTADMSGTPPGTYSVCGFSYAIAAETQLATLVGQDLSDMQAAFNSTTAPFCGDFSSDCITVIIGPAIPPTELDTMVCLGECIEIGGNFMCTSGTVIFESYLGCDSVVNVNFIPIVIPPANATATICPGECVTINNQQYCPPGPHIIVYDSWQGCDSVVELSMFEVPTVAIIQPSSPPPLSCANPTATLNGTASIPSSNIDFEWNGPSGFVGSTPVVTVDEPGLYTLTITNNNADPPCTNTATIEVFGNLNPPTLQLNSPPPSICAGQSFDLATLAIVDQNGTNPTITFHSATPATPANVLPSTTVNPSTTTTYYALGTSGNCTDEIPIILTVNSAPSATFTATSPICAGVSSVVTYTGGAGGGATFAWNFGGGTATPGVGQGPHLVTFGSAGTYTVSLTVTQGGCTSQPVQHTVQVDAPLAQPVINCGTTTSTSVQFVWADVPGATGYNVTVVSGQTGTQSGNTFTVNNLNPGTAVTLQVVAVGNGACGNSTATATCVSQNCPPVTININPVADICLSAGAPTIDLEATISGGSGGGTGTWSGTGITNASTGIFDPNMAGAGSHTITFNYTESACNFSATTTIDIFATPTSSFTTTSPICENATSTVTFTGTAGAGATFNWNFGGGTATPGTGAGPQTVTWASGGGKTVTLLVQENGCPSATTSQTVQVDELLEAPVVNCASTLNSVEFSWANVPGASSYNVTVSTGQTGVMNSPMSYLVSGLTTGEMVSVTVQAVSGNACPNTSTQASCTAQDCPNVTVTIDPVPDICLDGTTSPFFLTASQTGGAGGGTFTWTGPGLLNPASGLFDPEDANVGANAMVVTYAEGTCNYNSSLTINVFPQPTASFTAVSPICSSGASVVNYSGNASASANFTWDFGGGTATPGTGAGPHSVTWGSGGSQTITLMVEENGCASQTNSQTVSVETPLPLPQITCNSTTSSVEFFWNQIPDATGYNVTVVSGNGGLASSDTSFLFSNLAAGTQITIQVEAVNTGPCGSSMAQANCTAQNCPNVTLDIAPVNGICLGGNLSPFDLSATVSGGAGGGILTWSGTGITDPAAGTFNPAQAGQGSHTITATYEEGACQYSDNITIDVFPPPTADFTVQSPVCQGDNSVVEFTGTAQPGLTYTWDFGGGTATPGIGQGPHDVSWAATGSHVISLTVSAANGCASQPATQTVQVDQPLQAPVITCNPTTSSIEFTWTDV